MLKAGPIRPNLAFAIAIAAMLLSGCVSAFDRHRAELDSLLDEGRCDLVAAALDRTPYDENDHLLWLLDRGSAALALNDSATAIALLEEAEQLMEWRRRRDPGDALTMLLLNDRAARYVGEPYEDLYINVMKMLAHLEARTIAGGASVEARRMANKVDALRQEYLRLGTPAIDSAPPVVASAEGGHFIDSPLGTFLTAMIFMHDGDRSLAEVAGRRLRQAIEAQPELMGAIDPEPFATVGALEPEAANLLVVALSGRGPRKRAFPVGPIYVAYAPVYFELPVVEPQPQHTAMARVSVASLDRPAEPEIRSLHLVEDLGRVARENHQRQLPQIYARTLVRAAAKSYGLYEANRAVARASDHDIGAVAAMAVASLLVLGATERADLRTWGLLPGAARVDWLGLPPGSYRVAIEFLDSAGRVLHASPPRDVEVGREGVSTVVEAYWE